LIHKIDPQAKKNTAAPEPCAKPASGKGHAINKNSKKYLDALFDGAYFEVAILRNLTISATHIVTRRFVNTISSKNDR
jgi:hypothetical protein